MKCTNPGGALVAAFLVVLPLFTIPDIKAQDQQSAQARIAGKVLDFSGAILPGVNVTLTGGGDERTTSTGADGRFVFDAVKPYSAYTISIQLAGFMSDTRENIAVTAGETRTVDLAMEVGCVNSPFTVTGLGVFERLKGSTTVAHVRTTDTAVDRHDGCGPRRIAVIAAVSSSSPAAPTESATINLVGESGRFQADNEYLVVLGSPYGGKFPFFSPYWVREVVGGRVRGSDTVLDIQDGMPLEDAFRQLREAVEKANRDR